MDRPREGLRRQSSASWPVGPWLTSPLIITHFRSTPRWDVPCTPLWPRKPRCWPHAFWQSCAGGRLGALSKDADPIADKLKMVRPSLRAWPMVTVPRREGHLVKFLKKSSLREVTRPGHGQRLRAKVRPTGREIAARSRLAGHIGLVFHIAGAPLRELGAASGSGPGVDCGKFHLFNFTQADRLKLWIHSDHKTPVYAKYAHQRGHT